MGGNDPGFPGVAAAGDGARHGALLQRDIVLGDFQKLFARDRGDRKSLVGLLGHERLGDQLGERLAQGPEACVVSLGEVREFQPLARRELAIDDIGAQLPYEIAAWRRPAAAPAHMPIE